MLRRVFSSASSKPWHVRVGRVLVGPDLSVPGHQEVFVVGDLAAVKRDTDTWVPGAASAANQEGTHAAANVPRLIAGERTRLFVHIISLVDFRNRISVRVQRAYAYLTFQRGVRLITEAENVSPPVTGEWEVTRL